MSPDATILQTLRRHAPGHLAASELAELAGLAPAALAGRLDELRQAGYAIELHPHLGYRLASTPDRLIADDLTGRLRDAGVARLAARVLVFEETGSTNDVAARLGRAGAPEGAAVFAERQTAGRGRLGRRWDSAARQGLWFSLLVRPELPASDWMRLTTWAAVGVARGVEALLPGSRAAVKWPNDVCLEGRKVSGILIESAAGPPGGNSFAVVGIGLNLNQTAFPAELEGRAISLRQAAGPDAAPLDRQDAAVALLRELDLLYPRLAGGFGEIVAEAERRSLLTGRWITVQTPGGPLSGLAEGLEPDGSLRLRLESGEARILGSGEVTLAAS